MAKKKLPPKYPFGGLPDFTNLTSLLQGFQSSDPSKWMEQVANFTKEGNYSTDPDSFGRFRTPFSRLNLPTWQVDTAKSEATVSQLQGLQDLFEQFNRKTGDSYNPMNYMVNPTRGFQFGGEVDKAAPEQMLPTHIQTEKGEMISMPDYRIVPVKAKKRHSGMKDTDVTDILPPGSYVASRDKRMTISKEELEKVNLGFAPMEYNEEGTTELPKEMTAADIMRKSKQTPADTMRDIAQAFPEIKREKDPFAQMANELNLAARAPYVEAVKYVSENKKPKKAEPEMAKYGYMIPASQMPENPFANKLGLPGMEFKKGGKVPQADFGMLLNFLPQITEQLQSRVTGLMAPFQFLNQKKTIDKQRREGEQFFTDAKGQLSGLQNRQMTNLGLGTAAAALPSLLASSDYATPDRSGQFAALEAMPQTTPRSYYDYQMSQARQGIRPFLSMASRNTANAGQAMNMAQASQANLLNSIGNIANQRAMQDMGLRQSYLTQLGALRGQVAAEDAQKRNYQTGFANQRLSNLGSVGSNYFNQASTIDKAGTYGQLNLAGNRLGYMNSLDKAMGDARASMMNNFTQGMFGGSSLPTNQLRSKQVHKLGLQK
jgi:hypothetical protein